MKRNRLLQATIVALSLTAIPFSLQAADTTNAAETANTVTESKIDAEALSFLTNVDIHEINVADKAARKQLNDDVASYMKKIDDDHHTNLTQTQELTAKTNITPTETPAITKFKQQGDKQLSQLNALEGNKFQKQLINDMISGHEKVLSKLNYYLKNVKNEDIRNQLLATKTTVQNHLDLAIKLKEELDTNSSTNKVSE